MGCDAKGEMNRIDEFSGCGGFSLGMLTRLASASSLRSTTILLWNPGYPFNFPNTRIDVDGRDAA